MIFVWINKLLSTTMIATLIHNGCWVVTMLLLAILLLRIFAHDMLMILIWINSFTPFLYLPSYPIFLYAVLKRNWLLALLASLIMAYHLRTFAIPILQTRPSCTDSFTTKVMSVNLFARNKTLNKIIDEILFHDPDIIAFQEYTTNSHDRFRAEGVFEKWPYSVYIPREDTFGSAILSKRRIVEKEQFFLDEVRIPQTRAVVDVNGTRTNVINIHLVPPGIKHYSIHLQQQKALHQKLLSHKDAPQIILGDFNLTQHSRFISKISRSFSNAFDLAGAFFGATWPNVKWLPPVLRIDHIFLSDHFHCKKIEIGTGSGSDHRPLIAHLCFRKHPD